MFGNDLDVVMKRTVTASPALILGRERVIAIRLARQPHVDDGLASRRMVRSAPHQNLLEPGSMQGYRTGVRIASNCPQAPLGRAPGCGRRAGTVGGVWQTLPTVHPKFLTHDLNPAQREAVSTTVGPLCILAGAGTGKTRVISRRVAYAIATGAVHPGHVLVVTFTDKAAN